MLGFGTGSKSDTYGNNYGGAIYTPGGKSDVIVEIDNCTFKKNTAQYGGAIYMGSGVLNINNSFFYDNFAYNYGGAIACEGTSNITVSNSKFYNSKSRADAGGAIYVKSSKFKGNSIDIINLI